MTHKVRFTSKHIRQNPLQSGFTLIELLLYTAIVGSLLMAISLFFATTLDARIKNQSISEVEQQGTAIMERIAQAVRNASSVSEPSSGATATTLDLVMPTASESPTTFNLSGSSTVLGYNADGGSTDTDNSNFMNATRFTASASGSITTLYAFIGPTVASAPNNKAQMAIYSGTSTLPTTLLANSSEVTLAANSWNAFAVPSVNVTNGQTYWLAYNTNGTATAHNNMRYRSVGSNQSAYLARTYGTWPAPWVSATPSAVEFSMYASISSGGSPTPTLQAKRGTGPVSLLTNDKVEVSNLTFKNLSKPGTPGVLQFSFTISRVSSSSKNEYDYQKTFTGSAALPW